MQGLANLLSGAAPEDVALEASIDVAGTDARGGVISCTAGDIR